MQKFFTRFLSYSVIFLVVLDSCVSHDFPEYTCTGTYTFADDVKPIIEAKCAISGCHNGDLGQSLNWTNFETFHDHVESGSVKLRVTHRIMPPSSSPAGPLSPQQIDAIACWSDQGGLNN